ncbi:hypothetical protein MK489_10660 [Myxococcota bacterium]|nr:hypothetical protein [Myxococcota bacterium]
MDPQRTPVIAAAGQATERSEIVSTVEIAARASEAALEASNGLRDRIERVSMISVVFSPISPRPASELTLRLGLTGVQVESTTPGGNLPQWMVNRAAEEIAAGRLDTTLIAGGEATRSMRAGNPEADFMQSRRNDSSAAEPASEPDPIVGPSMEGVMCAAEQKIGLVRPTEVYPLFENALAHRQERSFSEQRAHLGPLMSSFSHVASENPFAWFQNALSAEEIATVNESNRLISEPYTKRMNAFPMVDQGAAVIVTSLATARSLGLEDRCIFVWSGASNTEPAPSTRRDLSDAPAMKAASAAALEAAGIGADDLSLIDLYSCFPVAVEVGASALGVQLDDSRKLTVTGGLPFFGGPGNNYSMHAIATIAARLPETNGLAYIGANGGFLSKHSIGVYGTTPPPRGFSAPDTSDAQARINASTLPIAEAAEGAAVVDSSTVVYDRQGQIEDAPVIATLEDGRRVAARAHESDRGALEATSLIGARVQISGTPARYRREDG